MQLSVVDKKGQAVDEGMEKIRELLFGQQLQRIDEQLVRLEGNLENGINQLRDELRKALGQEAAAREKGDNALGAELKSTTTLFGERLNLLETALRGELQSLQAHTGQRIDDLDTQMAAQHKGLFSALDSEGDRLQKEKLGREAMAELLEKLAGSLRGGAG
ncbi:MAG: hypothetical protein KJ558_13140 [Gammaproteobacteria bacterium]|nr:hypothetical protein [Gammaproteobacteria bacterium]MBU1655744.1 hypothetical protein [Gammaproteobacteria bacterium]MBU1960705.1 hypothetical protein [Gammaproteobacteria bacterium]